MSFLFPEDEEYEFDKDEPRVRTLSQDEESESDEDEPRIRRLSEKEIQERRQEREEREEKDRLDRIHKEFLSTYLDNFIYGIRYLDKDKLKEKLEKLEKQLEKKNQKLVVEPNASHIVHDKKVIQEKIRLLEEKLVEIEEQRIQELKEARREEARKYISSGKVHIDIRDGIHELNKKMETIIQLVSKQSCVEKQLAGSRIMLTQLTKQGKKSRTKSRKSTAKRSL